MNHHLIDFDIDFASMPGDTSARAIPVIARATGEYGERPRYSSLGDGIRGACVVSAAESAGRLSVFHLVVESGGGVSPHVHRVEDETFFVLDGRFVFGVGAETFEAGPGDCVFGPRGIEHTWRCICAGGGRMVGVFTPGDNFEAFMSGMARQNTAPTDA